MTYGYFYRIILFGKIEGLISKFKINEDLMFNSQLTLGLVYIL